MKQETVLTKEPVIAEKNALVVVTEEEKIKEQRIQEALRFFNLLHKSSPEGRYGYLWLLKRASEEQEKEEKLTRSFLVGNEQIHQKMAEEAIRCADEGWDVYCGLCTTDTPPDKYPLDFETAKSFLPITPSIIVNSGGGQHDYWFFGQVQIINDENRAQAE